MRERKIRAWDVEYKIMVGVVVFNLRKNADGVRNGLCVVYALEDGVFVKGRNYQQDYSKLIFMDYIGLKDKNGVEIYEGDILGISSSLYKDGKWNYHGKERYVNLKEVTIREDGLPELDYVNSLMSELNTFPSYEVIGNIHENKDLLEDK